MANNSGLPRVLAVTEGGTGVTSISNLKSTLGIENLGSGTNQVIVDQSGGDTTLAFPNNGAKTVTFPDGTCYAGSFLVKATTGEPSSPWPGLWVHNTVDSTLKVYNGSIWLTVAYT